MVQELVDKLYQNVDAPVDDLTDLVQEFYIRLGQRMDTHTLYKGEIMYTCHLITECLIFVE